MLCAESGRSMITGIDSLCDFLREHHREWSSDPGIPPADLPPLPDPLSRFYQQVGKLAAIEPGPETGWRAPLSQQDGIASPENLVRADGQLEFLWENQGNFACRTAERGEDPPVFSNWRHTCGESEVEFEQCCDSLSHFLVTFALQEAVMSCRYLVVPYADQPGGRSLGLPPLWLEGVYVDGRVTHQFHHDPGRGIIVMEMLEDLWIGSNCSDPVPLLNVEGQLNWITRPEETA